MTTIATAHGLCYCTGPWSKSIRVAPRMLDRAHIPGPDCEQQRQPEWLRRRNEAMNASRRRFGTARVADKVFPL